MIVADNLERPLFFRSVLWSSMVIFACSAVSAQRVSYEDPGLLVPTLAISSKGPVRSRRNALLTGKLTVWGGNGQDVPRHPGLDVDNLRSPFRKELLVKKRTRVCRDVGWGCSHQVSYVSELRRFGKAKYRSCKTFFKIRCSPRSYAPNDPSGCFLLTGTTSPKQVFDLIKKVGFEMILRVVKVIQVPREALRIRKRYEVLVSTEKIDFVDPQIAGRIGKDEHGELVIPLPHLFTGNYSDTKTHLLGTYKLRVFDSKSRYFCKDTMRIMASSPSSITVNYKS